jgi:hypothetical protein
MRAFLWGIVLLPVFVILYILASVYLYSGGPCVEPLYYSIGRVDKEFEISKDRFKGLVQKAEQVWEQAAQRELFQYRPNADYTVNLIYDERQQQTKRKQQVKKELERLRENRSDILNKYDRLTKQYEKAKAEYESLKEDYEARRTDLNERVREWNKEGKDSGYSYENLQQEKKKLDSLREKVKSAQNEVNRIVRERKEIAKREGELVRQYNTTAETYTERFGGARQFEKGDYNPDRITIYQYNAPSDLRLVLAHELGHALGIDHVKNPRSVMYYLLQEQSLDPIQLTNQDRQALQQVCQKNEWFSFF